MSDSIPVNGDSDDQGNAGQRVFLTSVLSLGLLWLSFPPVGWAPLGWLALIPLMGLVLAPSLKTPRPYWKLYAAGLLYWLATFYFVPIPHPALWAGWAAVSMYMAVYTPLTIAAARLVVHRFHVPAVIAIPIAWVGIEWIRCHFATGMGMVCLSHSQAQWPVLIQSAGYLGAYGVTLVMTMVASCFAMAWHSWRSKTATVSSKHGRSGGLITCGLAGAIFLLNLAFGSKQLADTDEVVADPLKIALVQTCQDAVFRPPSTEELQSRIDETIRLTHQAVQESPNLICWPESGLFPYQWQLTDVEGSITAAASRDVIRQYWQQAVAADLTGGTALLTGVLVRDVQQQQIFNSAVLIDGGQLLDRYDKNHPVMFGEYIPFGTTFPILERLAPMRSIEFGDGFISYAIAGYRVSPTICFETTVPHLVRRQINQLAAAGQEPDVMINLTNDGWFFGTACLDHHLACNVFRAVEMQKPHWVCANTGFSAEIDSRGRIRQIGPRRATDVIIASTGHHQGSNFYRRYGDVGPMVFGYLVIVVLVVELLLRGSRRWRVSEP